VNILIKVLIGALGLVGFLLRFVGPLTIAPVLIQIGISLTMPAVDYCKGNWAVAIIVMFVLILCMEILARFAIPIPGYNFKEKKCTLVHFIFQFLGVDDSYHMSHMVQSMTYRSVQ